MCYYVFTSAILCSLLSIIWLGDKLVFGKNVLWPLPGSQSMVKTNPIPPDLPVESLTFQIQEDHTLGLFPT